MNQDIAQELGNRIGRGVFLYCLLNALLLTPIVFYLSIDETANLLTLSLNFVLLTMAFSLPMALFNGLMTWFWIQRISDNVSITMKPEALRSRLFLSNYLGLPVMYLLTTALIALINPLG